MAGRRAVMAPWRNGQRYAEVSQSQVYFYRPAASVWPKAIIKASTCRISDSCGRALAASFARPVMDNGAPSSQRCVERHHQPFRKFPPVRDPPLQQVDLFVEWCLFQHADQPGAMSRQSVDRHLNGYPITYIVPTNATVSTAAAGLASLINAATTHPGEGLVHGDRIGCNPSPPIP